MEELRKVPSSPECAADVRSSCGHFTAGVELACLDIIRKQLTLNKMNQKTYYNWNIGLFLYVRTRRGDLSGDDGGDFVCGVGVDGRA